MRKAFVLLALVFGMAVPVVAYAADLNPNQANQFSCPYGGSWHFVNVQTGGSQTPANLHAVFSGGAVDAIANKVNNHVQQWDVTATGTLISAQTNLGGFIVLSDYTCSEKKGK